MAEMKTRLNDGDVRAFLDTVETEARRRDAHAMCALFEKATGQPARMWGPAIVGFGQYHYKYESGREGDMCVVGFSPRKANFSLYLITKPAEFDTILARLGKYKTAKSCIYINRLDQVDLGVLEELIRLSYQSTVDHG